MTSVAVIRQLHLHCNFHLISLVFEPVLELLLSAILESMISDSSGMNYCIFEINFLVTGHSQKKCDPDLISSWHFFFWIFGIFFQSKVSEIVNS